MASSWNAKDGPQSEVSKFLIALLRRGGAKRHAVFRRRAKNCAWICCGVHVLAALLHHTGTASDVHSAWCAADIEKDTLLIAVPAFEKSIYTS